MEYIIFSGKKKQSRYHVAISICSFDNENYRKRDIGNINSLKKNYFSAMMMLNIQEEYCLGRGKDEYPFKVLERLIVIYEMGPSPWQRSK